MKVSQILPQLFIGPCPEAIDDIGQLKTDRGITAILSLQTDEDLDQRHLSWSQFEARCWDAGITARRVPVESFTGDEGLGKLVRCVAELDELLRDGRVVYVHCNFGTVRSPGVVVAYLAWRQGWRLKDAVDHLQQCHNCSPDAGAIFLAGSGLAAA